LFLFFDEKMKIRWNLTTLEKEEQNQAGKYWKGGATITKQDRMTLV
jgi:hypothetical protein